jgi:PucR family transcriptional regulator, purine catabolism regulatory protein
VSPAGSETIGGLGPRARPDRVREANPARKPGPLPDLVPELSRQNSVYRRMMIACDKLAAAAVQDADVANLTEIFAETAGKTVVLLDSELRLQAQAAGAGEREMTLRWEADDPSLTKLLGMLAAERRPLRVPPVPGSAFAYGCLATPVLVGDAILGYLLVLDDTAADADDVDLIVTGYAAAVFALTLARAQTSLELGLRYRGAVVDSLVSGHFLDSQDARRMARLLGVADAQPFRVAVARVSTAAASRRGRLDEIKFADEFLSPLVGSLECAAAIRGPELVLLLPGEEQPQTLLRHQVGATVLTYGLSELTEGPEMAPQALRQAQHAIDLGIRLGRTGQTISYEELGIYRLLFQIGDLEQLWQFAEDVLGPLIEYEARHKVDLIGTLSVYLNQRESLKQTARILRVHVNTVTYRIQRIEQLTSLELANPDHRLSAHVATKIIESRSASHLERRRTGRAFDLPRSTQASR